MALRSSTAAMLGLCMGYDYDERLHAPPLQTLQLERNSHLRSTLVLALLHFLENLLHLIS